MKWKKRITGWLCTIGVLVAAFPIQGFAVKAAEPQTGEESLVQIPMKTLEELAESNCEQNPADGNDGPSAFAFNGNTGNWWHTRWKDDNKPEGGKTSEEWNTVRDAYKESGFQEGTDYAYIGSGFGKIINLKKIECQIREESCKIVDYRLLTSLDGKEYTPVNLSDSSDADGTIKTFAYEGDIGVIELSEAVPARYFRIQVLSVGDRNHAAVKNIKVFGYPYSEELHPQLKIDTADYSFVSADAELGLADFAEDPASLDILDAEFENDPQKGYVISGKLMTDAEKLNITGNTPILLKFDFCSEKPSGKECILGRMDHQYGIQLESGRIVMFNDRGSDDWREASYSMEDSKWGADAWHTVIGVFNGVQMQLFVDGYAGNAADTSMVSHSKPFCIGYNYESSGRGFHGKLANIEVYTGNQVPIFQAKTAGEDFSDFLAEQLAGKKPSFALGVRPHYTVKDAVWNDDGANVTVAASLVPDEGYYFHAENLSGFTFGDTPVVFTEKELDAEGVLHISYQLTAEQAAAYRAYQEKDLEDVITNTISALKTEIEAVAPSPRFPAAEQTALLERIAAFRTATAGMTITEKQQELAKLKVDCESFLKGKRTPVLQVGFEDNVKDTSGFENNGTAEGSPEYVDGVRGKAIHLVNAGTDSTAVASQYVNFGKGEELQFGTGDFTIGLWYKSSVQETSNGRWGAIISNKDWSSGDHAGINMGHMNQSGSRKWGVNWNVNTKTENGAEGSRIETDTYEKAADGKWHYLTGVVDRSNQQIRFYIDGELAEQKSAGGKFGTVDAGYDLVLGADGNEHKYGNKDACFDELVIYREALPEEMIAALAADGQRMMEIREMEAELLKAEPGGRFSEAAIAEMAKQVADTKEQLETLTDEQEKERIFDALLEHYEAFLVGTPAVSFHMISDIHAGDKSSGNWKNLEIGLKNMKKMNPKADAFVSCGDNTEYGSESETKDFFDLIKANYPALGGKVLVTMGNHDVRGRDNWVAFPETEVANWKNAYRYYMENNKDFMPDMPETLTGEEKTYFDYWINGYHFIVLNAENSPKDQAYMTEGQLEWLEEKLQEGENEQNPYDSEKPVFVFIHQALEDTHQHAGQFNGFGPSDALVKEILGRYPQTVLCTGHIHNGFGVSEIIERSYGTMVDVPSFKMTGGWNQSQMEGSGYEVYVYEDEIVFRAADFLKGEWMPEYDYSVKLASLPVLVKKAERLREQDYTTASWDGISAELKTELAAAKKLLNQRYSRSVSIGDTAPETFLYHEDTRAKIDAVQKKLADLMGSLVLSDDRSSELEDKIDKLEEEKKAADEAKKKAEAAEADAKKDLQQAIKDKEAAEAAKQEAEDQAKADKEKADQDLAQAKKDKEAAEAAKKEAEEKARKEKEKAEQDLAQANRAKAEAEAALKEAKAQAEAARKAAEDAKAALQEAKKNVGAKKIGKPTLVSVKSSKSGTLKITWKKLANVSGYEIQYALNGKFKNAIVKKAGASKTSLTLKKLRKGKKYYVRIRGYRKDADNSTFGAYSKKKSVNIKK